MGDRQIPNPDVLAGKRYASLPGHNVQPGRLAVFGTTNHGSTEPRPPRTPPGNSLSLSDANLLDRARNAANGDRFRQLYDEGAWEAHGGDHSRADLALCGLLAFWTHGDAACIDRLFRNSALMRNKWDERHAADGKTYGEMTIGKVLGS